MMQSITDTRTCCSSIIKKAAGLLANCMHDEANALGLSTLSELHLPEGGAQLKSSAPQS